MIEDRIASESESVPSEELYYEGLNRLEAGRLSEAVSLFRACLKKDSGMLDAMHGLIRALRESGKLDEAISTAHRLAEIDPDDSLAHTSLSILYQQKGMIAEAETEATKAKLLGWKKQLREEGGERR